jgi:mitosis inhibitor protein kinase SWE1
MIPKKYKPRDSGVSFENEDKVPAMPTVSTSISTIHSGDGLATPIFGPETASGWPLQDDVIVFNSDEDGFMQVSTSSSGNTLNTGVDPDGFIMRLLVDVQSSQVKDTSSRRMPGTPVKRMKMTHFAIDRPWQSAFTNKIGSEEFNYLAPPPGKEGNGKKPRKSLPGGGAR